MKYTDGLPSSSKGTGEIPCVPAWDPTWLLCWSKQILSLLLWVPMLPNYSSSVWKKGLEETAGHSPSLLGLPRILLISAFVGFCPSARTMSPTWLRVILASPVLSKRRKASLKSAREEQWLNQAGQLCSDKLYGQRCEPLASWHRSNDSRGVRRGIFDPWSQEKLLPSDVLVSLFLNFSWL